MLISIALSLRAEPESAGKGAPPTAAARKQGATAVRKGKRAKAAPAKAELASPVGPASAKGPRPARPVARRAASPPVRPGVAPAPAPATASAPAPPSAAGPAPESAPGTAPESATTSAPAPAPVPAPAPAPQPPGSWADGLSTERQEKSWSQGWTDPAVGPVQTHLGATELVPDGDRLSLHLGHEWQIDGRWLLVMPEADVSFGPVTFGVAIPLRVRSTGPGLFDGGGVSFRPGDWSDARDAARLLRFLSYGGKEDPVFVDVSQLHAFTIGHGAVVRRYADSLGAEKNSVGAELDAHARYAGLEAFAGDVTRPDGVVGGLAFVRPLAWLQGDGGQTLGRTSLGLSYAADRRAPSSLARERDRKSVV
jgi:hypothetical protein